MQILNRIVTLASEGLTYEAAPRNEELSVKNLGLSNSNSKETPGIKDSDATIQAAKVNSSMIPNLSSEPEKED